MQLLAGFLFSVVDVLIGIVLLHVHWEEIHALTEFRAVLAPDVDQVGPWALSACHTSCCNCGHAITCTSDGRVEQL
jgi:hypothetical protein